MSVFSGPVLAPTPERRAACQELADACGLSLVELFPEFRHDLLKDNEGAYIYGGPDRMPPRQLAMTSEVVSK